MANQVVVQTIQSLAGNHVLVPAPELQVLSTLWNINGNLSLITGVTLNLTTVGPGPTNQTKLYQIFIQVSCIPLPPATGAEFTCATGSGSITLPVNMNGKSAFLIIPITPRLDPELVEVHDLSFIVTGSPSTTPPPPAPCDSTFVVKSFPPAVTINRTITNIANVTKTIIYPPNANPCPKILVNLSAKSTPPGLAVSIVPTTSVVLTPGQAFTVSEIIAAGPITPPGQYTVVETDTSGQTTVTVVTQVFVS